MDYGHCDSLKWNLLEGKWMYKYGFFKKFTKLLQIGYPKMVNLLNGLLVNVVHIRLHSGHG